jgi:L-aspartate semialdehyde sulfurtransferase ferredoxin
MAATTPKRMRPTRKMSAPRAREKIYLTYPVHLIKEPIIYELGTQFALKTNIRGANVSDTMGLVALELEGNRREIDRGIAWLRARGVTVEPIEKNVIE